MTTEKSMDAVGDDTPSLIGVESFAQLMDVSPRTIRRRLTENKVPKPIRLGRLVKWLRKEVEEWIAAKCPDLTRVQKVRGA